MPCLCPLSFKVLSSDTKLVKKIALNVRIACFLTTEIEQNYGSYIKQLPRIETLSLK